MNAQNPDVPDVPTHPQKVRVMITCGACCITLRAPKRHPELDDFRARHEIHGNGLTKVTKQHANVWTESAANTRLKAEMGVLQKKLSEQRKQIARLETR